MNNKLRRYALSLVLAALLSICFLVGNAVADEGGALCTISIPLAAEMNGEAPRGFESSFVIEAVTEGAPLPGETEISLAAEGSGSFGPISYTKPGDYSYRISQVTAPAERLTLDETVYEVTVRVLNSEDGGMAAVWAKKDNSKWGKDEIIYNNTYASPPVPTPTVSPTETPTPTAKPEKSGDVRTGDRSAILLWVLLLAASAAVLVRARRQSQG